MTNPSGNINIGHYIRLVIRHRWLVIFPVVVSVIAGIYLALTLPKVYRTQTLILVEPQRVPQDFVQSLVSIDINSRISTIEQQVMSWTNLEKIIGEFNLFQGPEHENMFMEDKVGNLRKRIEVDVMRERKGADAFSISFSGREPEKVRDIANALATYFINENLKVREEQAIGTSSFLDDELITMRKRLEKVEKALGDYRQAHLGELPDQLDSNLRVLDRLQMQLAVKEESLSMAKNRLMDIDSTIQTIRDRDNREVQVLVSPDSAATPEVRSEKAIQLEKVKEQLALFQTRYTDKHPDIIRLKKTIKNLEAAVESERRSMEAEEAEGPSEDTVASEPAARKRTYVDRAKLDQRREVLRDIEMLENEIARIRNQIQLYEKRVENTPKREQELLSLQRDYGNIQEQYNSMLNRKLEAEIAVNMERKQKGEQFRILDPARLPQKPFKPDMRKLFLFSIAAGFGIGGGLIFLIDFFDASFKGFEEIESSLKVPVLAMIPVVLQPRDILRRRINLMLSLASIAVTLMLVAGFAALVFLGVDQTKAIVAKYLVV